MVKRWKDALTQAIWDSARSMLLIGVYLLLFLVIASLIEQLLPHLEPGDILIDGGNSHFPDTIRRTRYVESKGLLYIGTGVSGGEEGALKGPSMMPGGSPAAWPYVKPIFQAICAKVEDGSPCCDWVGENGAGHFVKMVHNGIEYGDMQLICEAYQLMRGVLGMTADEMHEVFRRWNETELDSYLIEITRDILAFKDTDGKPLVEDGKAHFYPVGAGLFSTFYAPANWNETVNTIGLAFYAKTEPRRMGKGWDMEVQSNPVCICHVPGALAELSLA